MNEFLTEYEYKKNIINEYIDKDLEVLNSPYKKIIEAMRYSVLSQGKRLRPILLMSCFEIFDEDIKSILPFCAAIEYIHCYSLIHDDLPAMDNDDLRRGNPTCHKKFGEGLAILAGDALLNYAYEKMANSNIGYWVDATKVIAAAAGKDGMIGGQVIDILNEGKKMSLKLLNNMHALKTGALMRCSCMAGAILGGGNSEDIDNFGEFGSLIGLSFQIQDDILDVTSNEKTLGKPVGSDSKNKKTTYLSHCSLDECNNIINELLSRANLILDNYKGKEKFLKELLKFLTNREN